MCSCKRKQQLLQTSIYIKFIRQICARTNPILQREIPSNRMRLLTSPHLANANANANAKNAQVTIRLDQSRPNRTRGVKVQLVLSYPKCHILSHPILSIPYRTVQFLPSLLSSPLLSAPLPSLSHLIPKKGWRGGKNMHPSPLLSFPFLPFPPVPPNQTNIPGTEIDRYIAN